jgi:poly-gamma-glutamate synthesis protein (capsule biosynthesis protein)
MQNTHNKNKLMVWILSLVLLVVTAGCQLSENVDPSQGTQGTNKPVQSLTPIPSPLPSTTPSKPPDIVPSASPSISPVPYSTTVKLAAVGDILIHSSVYKDAKTAEGYDFKPMFADIKPYIEAADIAMANQESMIGGEAIGLADYPRFNSPFEVGDALKATGFDVVNLANNHTLDAGEQAVQSAIEHWNSIGMMYTGAYTSAKDQKRIRTVEKNGISFAFLSYTYGTNGIPVPAGKGYLVNLIDLPKVRKDIEEARKLAEVVVVNVHFGVEYVDMPNKDQKDFAHTAAEAGADIIIGHHPHVLQPAEWIETASGRKAFVVYSLGNFIAAQETNGQRTGGILQLEVEKEVRGDNVQIKVQKPSFIPTWIMMTNWRQYKIVPLWKAPNIQLPDASSYNAIIQKHMKQWMPELVFPME